MSRSLTGGTGDVNPQFFTGSVTEPSNDQTGSDSFPIPIQRLPTRGRAQVMEVLKVYFQIPWVSTTASTSTFYNIQVYLLTSDPGVIDVEWDNPRIFAGTYRIWSNAFTAAGSYSTNPTEQIQVIDLTDGAGHGVLIGTDRIYAQIHSDSTNFTHKCRFKILYRWKDVSLAEYIGMVQSQQ